MEELRVPIRAAEVEIHTTGGQRHRGSLFVPASPQSAGGAEELLALLNDERVFVPFVGADTTAFALNKDHVVRLRLPAEHADHASAPEQSEDPPALLVLSDGARFRGRILVGTPWSESRVVDRLNRAERFLPVATEGGLEIVQRCCIVRVLS